MLLTLLRERGERLTLCPPGYQERPIRAFVDVDDAGALRGFVENADASAKRGLRIPVPSRKRAYGARPILCADGPDYLFGLAETDDKADQARTRRDLHLALLTRCVEETGSSLAEAALGFLTAVRDDAELPGRVAILVADYPGDLSLRVGGRLVTDEPSVQQFWAREVGLGETAGTTAETRCTVCRGLATIPQMWPVGIKGIPGGESSGSQLVSMNSDAFESYGQSRATGAMVCAPCGERIANALNALLADRQHRVLLGPVAYVAWSTSEGTIDFFEILNNPQPDLVRQLLVSPLTAKGEQLKEDTGDLVTLGLSATAARAVVREWDVVPIPQVRERLRRYFAAQMVVGEWGEPATPLGLRALAAASLRDPRDLSDAGKVSATSVTALLRGIIAGQRLPAALAVAVIRRIVAQGSPRVRQSQAALLTWFLTQSQENLAVPHDLDPSLHSPAYQCGRALAEIDAIQRSAMGRNINATVVDRYFGAASSRPGTVLGLLIRNAQDHLHKLRASNEAAAVSHDRRLTEILDQVGQIPATLSLTEQTLFCLGFYHQRADDRRSMLRHKQDRQPPIPPSESDTPQEIGE